jgi:hypothetical protein
MSVRQLGVDAYDDGHLGGASVSDDNRHDAITVATGVHAQEKRT